MYVSDICSWGISLLFLIRYDTWEQAQVLLWNTNKFTQLKNIKITNHLKSNNKAPYETGIYTCISVKINKMILDGYIHV